MFVFLLIFARLLALAVEALRCVAKRAAEEVLSAEARVQAARRRAQMKEGEALLRAL